MTIDEAIGLIRPGVIPARGTWADIGAGTGIFTLALMQILENGKVIAVDKNPHGLYDASLTNHNSNIELEILEGDFHTELHLPSLDGIIIANALHYAHDHTSVLKNVMTTLKPGGSFILIEYDTEKPNPPWVPNPVSLILSQQLFRKVGLDEPKLIGRRESIYNDGVMYVVRANKI